MDEVTLGLYGGSLWFGSVSQALKAYEQSAKRSENLQKQATRRSQLRGAMEDRWAGVCHCVFSVSCVFNVGSGGEINLPAFGVDRSQMPPPTVHTPDILYSKHTMTLVLSSG